MNIAESVNTDHAWCVPGLATFNHQFLILNRCTLFVSEMTDCLEFVSQWSSVEVVDWFDSRTEAQHQFARLFDYDAALETVRSKPIAHDYVRTVSIRDHCGGLAA
jgi:hypothetical protein